MILPYKGRWPKIHETTFIAPSADIIGDVEIEGYSSVWFQVVIRGDVHRIRIGNRTNIQDHSVLHVTREKSPLLIGNEVTIGHRVVLHGCTIGNRCLIGMGSILLDDVQIGDDCLIGAGSLITKKIKIPPRSLVLGSPAKIVRSLTDHEVQFLIQSAENYVHDRTDYYGVIQGPKKMGAHQIDLGLFSEEMIDDDKEE